MATFSKPSTLSDFAGQHAYLSNFFPCNDGISFAGRVYMDVEHAYQAAKSRKPRDRNAMLKARTPHEAKKLGRSFELRGDWEHIKDRVMFMLLDQKFDPIDPRSQASWFAEQLLLTGEVTLIEGNYWHDNYWGDCSCSACEGIEGQNKLGKMLMKLRKELAQ